MPTARWHYDKPTRRAELRTADGKVLAAIVYRRAWGAYRWALANGQKSGQANSYYIARRQVKKALREQEKTHGQ